MADPGEKVALSRVQREAAARDVAARVRVALVEGDDPGAEDMLVSAFHSGVSALELRQAVLDEEELAR